MSLSKPKKFYIVLVVFLALIYNILLFIIKKDFVTVSWISYFFTMVGFVVLLFDAFIPEEKFSRYPMFGLSVSTYSITFFVIQLVFGILLMLFDGFNTTFALVIEILLLAFYLFRIIQVLVAKEIVAKQDNKVKQKEFYIRSLLIELEDMSELVTDEELKKSIEQLTEDIRFSDPMSHESLVSTEERIRMNIASLRDNIDAGRAEDAVDSVSLIKRLVRERNSKCLLLK